MHKGGGKLLIWRLFVPSPDWPSILAGNRTRSSPLGGRYTVVLNGDHCAAASQSLQVFQSERLGLEVLWHRVHIKFVKAVGLTIGHSPEDLNKTI